MRTACSHPGAPALLLAALVATAPAARAGAVIEIPDVAYATRPVPRQEVPVTGPIATVIHPTPGAPALAVAGDVLEVWLARRFAGATPRISATLSARLAGVPVRLPLALIDARQGPGTDLTRLRFRLPPTLPRETFDLAIGLPHGATEVQRRAVRGLLAPPGSPRLAVMTDHQLRDATPGASRGRRNARAYPTRGETRETYALTRQIQHELDLHDPDVALHLGDLVFGLDYAAEYPEVLGLLASDGPATFMTPGNHDAFARYGLDVRGSWRELGRAARRCGAGRLAPLLRLGTDALLRWLLCVHGDTRAALFGRRIEDGLHAYRRTLGPDRYTTRLGPHRLVVLNTYDGTPERRHTLTISARLLRRSLGAPLVDNYGGYLGETQLRWARAQIRAAWDRREPLIVAGHHDPRGNPRGQRYHPNLDFPTRPFGAGGFQWWNFEDAWDSDPADGRRRESLRSSSATALLGLLAEAGGVYLSGHVHRDAQRTYQPGQTVVPGVVARRPVTFVQVTTAAGVPADEGYWGYRLIGGGPPDRPLDTTAFHAAAGLRSVPAGNLWADLRPLPASGAGAVATVHTGLPRPVTIRLRLRLPHRPDRGWRFAARPATGVGLRLLDVHPLGGNDALHYLEVRLPAAGTRVALRPADVRATTIHATPDPVNQPPAVAITVDGAPVGDTLDLPVGRALLLDATTSRDPDGDPLLPVLWELPGGRGGRGGQVRLARDAPSEHVVHCSIRDARGALARRTVRIRVLEAPAPASPPR